MEFILAATTMLDDYVQPNSILLVSNKKWVGGSTKLMLITKKDYFSCSLKIYIHNILPQSSILVLLLVDQQCILSYLQNLFEKCLGIPKRN